MFFWLPGVSMHVIIAVTKMEEGSSVILKPVCCSHGHEQSRVILEFLFSSGFSGGF